MKKMFFALMTMLTVSISVNAMSYEQARNEALFLTDSNGSGTPLSQPPISIAHSTGRQATGTSASIAVIRIATTSISVVLTSM